MWVAIQCLGLIGSAVLTFIGYKQTDSQRDKKSVYLRHIHQYITDKRSEEKHLNGWTRDKVQRNAVYRASDSLSFKGSVREKWKGV